MISFWIEKSYLIKFHFNFNSINLHNFLLLDSYEQIWTIHILFIILLYFHHLGKMSNFRYYRDKYNHERFESNFHALNIIPVSPRLLVCNLVTTWRIARMNSFRYYPCKFICIYWSMKIESRSTSKSCQPVLTWVRLSYHIRNIE